MSSHPSIAQSEYKENGATTVHRGPSIWRQLTSRKYYRKCVCGRSMHLCPSSDIVLQRNAELLKEKACQRSQMYVGVVLSDPNLWHGWCLISGKENAAWWMKLPLRPPYAKNDIELLPLSIMRRIEEFLRRRNGAEDQGERNLKNHTWTQWSEINIRYKAWIADHKKQAKEGNKFSWWVLDSEALPLV